MSAWPPDPDLVASEGAEMIEVLAVDPRHGVVTDDLAWGKPRGRRFAKTDAKRSSRDAAPERRKPGPTSGLRDTPTAFEGGDDDG